MESRGESGSGFHFATRSLLHLRKRLAQAPKLVGAAFHEQTSMHPNEVRNDRNQQVSKPNMRHAAEWAMTESSPFVNRARPEISIGSVTVNVRRKLLEDLDDVFHLIDRLA